MERFEALGNVVRIQEGVQVLFQFLVACIVVALHGRILQCPVHAFDLTVGPRVVGFGQPVLDLVFPAYANKDMLPCIAIPFAVRALDAVVGQNRMDAVGHGGNQIP